MTIDTQVHLDDGTKTSNTICGGKSKGILAKNAETLNKEKRERSDDTRLKLSTLSRYLKAKQKKLAEETKCEKEAKAILAKPVNVLLIEYYRETTGATTFKKFKEWKAQGFSVKRNETAFRVWAAPSKNSMHEENSTPDQGDGKSKRDFFPTCCLFSDLQVEKCDSNGEKSTESEHKSSAHPNDSTFSEIKVATAYLGDSFKQQEKQPLKIDLKLAVRLRSIAEKLKSDINNAFSDRLENTPRRIAQAAHARQKGYHLQRTQKALYALANCHESGSVPELLKKLKTKKAIHNLLALRTKSVENGYHTYHVEIDERVHDNEHANALWDLIEHETEDNATQEAHRQKINSVKLSNIAGYFPTPENIIERMCDLACVDQDHIVLEPEAGAGAILDFLKNKFPDIALMGYEINFTLYDIVKANHPLVTRENFLEVNPIECADRILMNPPFEQLQDIDHIRHAFKFLRPLGRLVGIMSPSAFFRSDKKSQGFREWFYENNGYAEDLPDGSFKQSGTSVRTKLILLEKF